MSNGIAVFGGSGEGRHHIPAPPPPPASASWEARTAASELREQSFRIYTQTQNAVAIAKVLDGALEKLEADATAKGDTAKAAVAHDLRSALAHKTEEMAAFAEKFDEAVDQAYEHFVATGGQDPTAFFAKGSGLWKMLSQWGLMGGDAGLLFDFMLIVSLIQDWLGSLLGTCNATDRWLCENLWMPRCDPPMVPDPPCKYVSDTWEPGDPPPGGSGGGGGGGAGPNAIPEEGAAEQAEVDKGGPGGGSRAPARGEQAATGVGAAPPPTADTSKATPSGTGAAVPHVVPTGSIGWTPGSVATPEVPVRTLTVCEPYIKLARRIVQNVYAERHVELPGGVISADSTTWAVADAAMLYAFARQFEEEGGRFNFGVGCIQVEVSADRASGGARGRVTASPAGGTSSVATPLPAGPTKATPEAAPEDGTATQVKSAGRGSAPPVSPSSPDRCQIYWTLARAIMATLYAERGTPMPEPVLQGRTAVYAALDDGMQKEFWRRFRNDPSGVGADSVAEACVRTAIGRRGPGGQAPPGSGGDEPSAGDKGTDGSSARKPPTPPPVDLPLRPDTDPGGPTNGGTAPESGRGGTGAKRAGAGRKTIIRRLREWIETLDYGIRSVVGIGGTDGRRSALPAWRIDCDELLRTVLELALTDADNRFERITKMLLPVADAARLVEEGDEVYRHLERAKPGHGTYGWREAATELFYRVALWCYRKYADPRAHAQIGGFGPRLIPPPYSKAPKTPPTWKECRFILAAYNPALRHTQKDHQKLVNWALAHGIGVEKVSDIMGGLIFGGPSTPGTQENEEGSLGTLPTMGYEDLWKLIRWWCYYYSGAAEIVDRGMWRSSETFAEREVPEPPGPPLEERIKQIVQEVAMMVLLIAITEGVGLALRGLVRGLRALEAVETVEARGATGAVEEIVGSRIPGTVKKPVRPPGSVIEAAEGASESAALRVRKAAIEGSAGSPKPPRVPPYRDVPIPRSTKDYPDFSGFADGKSTTTTLNKGEVFDRFGLESGKQVAPAGTPWWQRSLPGGRRGYGQYRVIRPIENVQVGKSAGAFEQPGGGVQIVLPRPIEDLVKEGYIERVVPFDPSAVPK